MIGYMSFENIAMIGYISFENNVDTNGNWVGIVYQEGARYSCNDLPELNCHGFHYYKHTSDVPYDYNKQYARIKSGTCFDENNCIAVTDEIEILEIGSYDDICNIWSDDEEEDNKIPTDGMYVDEKGNKFWYVNGVLHRDHNDEPAVEYANGDKEWYCVGRLHRQTGPAYITSDESRKVWYEHGSRTKEYSFGDTKWIKNDRLHRDYNDEPAVIHKNGDKEWYQNGEHFRYGGRPTIERANGHKVWHRIDGSIWKEEFTSPV